MGRLILAWLGVPAVAHAGRPVAFSTRKTLALLAYLSAGDGPRSREQLSALLWPDSAETQSRASLRRSLAFLREALDDAEPGSHLLVERDAIGLNPDADTELDLRRLQVANQAARRQAARSAGPPAPAALLAEWRAAAQLVRGDFLEGFSLRDAPAFDDWASQQREYWHRQAVGLHAALSRLQSEAGDSVAAIETAARWVVLDPLDDSAAARLMQLHAAQADRPAALQAYESYRARLAAELRAEPSPETQALAERLRGGHLPARPPARPAPAAPAAALKTPWVGRAPEFARLVEAYHLARAGRLQVVVLQGEAGIGKTRLASEFLGWAAGQGAVVLQGRAFETGGALPYQLIVEALRGAPALLSGLRGRLTDTWLGELARLLPELRDAYPDLVLRAPEDAAQAQLFEAVARLGETLARQSPLLIFVDDVQWAETASLDLLHYAARRWLEGAAPVLVLAGRRSEPTPATPAVDTWMASLERDLPLRHLLLAALTDDDTLKIVSAFGQSGDAPSASAQADFSRWLFGETAGQPLFIVETLRALLDRGVLVAEPGLDGVWQIDFGAAQAGANLRGLLPPGVLELIRSRLARQTSAAQALLAAAAVLGRQADFDRLRSVAGMSEDEALYALESLLAGQLLRETSNRAGYAFTHDKIRDVAYAEAGSARQRVYHRRALELLGAQGAPAAELAHHALQARLPEPAYRYSVAAGDEALQLFAARDAIAHYEQALALVRAEDVLSAADLRPLYTQLGRAYDLAGDLARAQQTYEELLALARRLGDTRAERLALNRLATLAAQSGGNVAATEWLRQAQAIADADWDLAGIAETEWNLAQMGYYTWDEAHVLAHAQRALRLAQEAGGPELIARCQNVLALAHWVLGRFVDSEHHSRLAQQLYADLGNRIMEADSQCVLAEAQIRLGRHVAGIDTARLAYATGRDLRNPWGQIGAACRLALALKENGQLEAALSIADDAAAVSRSVAAAHWLIIALCLRGAIYRDLQAFERALAEHLEAQSVADGPVSPIFKAMPGAHLCADYAAFGQWEPAYRWLPAAPSWRELTLCQGLVRWHTIETLIRHGEHQRAAAEVRAFELQAGDNPRYRIAYLRCVAVLNKSRGDPGQAIAALAEAAVLADRLALPNEAWTLYAEMSRLHQELGNPASAQQAATQAGRIAQGLAGNLADERRRSEFLHSPAIASLEE